MHTDMHKHVALHVLRCKQSTWYYSVSTLLQHQKPNIMGSENQPIEKKTLGRPI